MIAMDRDALAAFLLTDFAEVADQFAVDAADADGVTLRLIVGRQHLRPGGTISGPATFALADVAAYLAILSRIGPVALAVTTNCSIDFMRKPAARRDLTARASVLKLGRTLAVTQVMVDQPGQEGPVARAGLTYALPRRNDGV